ncbi:MAG: hypothetical protein D6680_01435 [Cyanobacteria bacterium J007]|nr:MAG: hypothetical protein D6680_01435 [Cyanobacteria bacterium J007]
MNDSFLYLLLRFEWKLSRVLQKLIILAIRLANINIDKLQKASGVIRSKYRKLLHFKLKLANLNLLFCSRANLK